MQRQSRTGWSVRQCTVILQKGKIKNEINHFWIPASTPVQLTDHPLPSCLMIELLQVGDTHSFKAYRWPESKTKEVWIGRVFLKPGPTSLCAVQHPPIQSLCEKSKKNKTKTKVYPTCGFLDSVKHSRIWGRGGSQSGPRFKPSSSWIDSSQRSLQPPGLGLPCAPPPPPPLAPPHHHPWSQIPGCQT